ncbi:MAG: Aspartyl-tRNA synthetase [Candidatus Adlerbacteria bacterium GW2011_GWB1_54_7]|uniref:Aspartate--tRNA ligase n=1 Tax=Candidatus Adlerbacteria bacterium GW2011_GWB1_54_7 TaxID=1618607 RepID=A0A0G1Y260_9BACT|nr:MAG: Aspartyl-tRNA synthetase [Candidatus Adlerbacteria bacterium GW2011_GWB1_54_7]
MERTLIGDLATHKGEVVLIQGWVSVRRDQGKMVFFDFRDRSGSVQGVVLPKSEAIEAAKEVRNEYVVSVTGTVNVRPEKNVNAKVQNGDIELEVTNIEVLAVAEPLPFDMSQTGYNLDLTTELDHRALVLRHPRVQAIFKVQAVIIDSFREYMKSQEFFEFQAPTIVPAVAEGGAEVFKVDYFDKKAYLSQSPQLYKQIVMTAFERVFSVNKIFRAEPSSTTRHLTEVVSLDAEMSFIKSWEDVRDMAEATVRFILLEVQTKCAKELELLGATLPAMVDKTPTLSLTEALQKLGAPTSKDLNPEQERKLCEIVYTETGSDFVFVYGYPTKQKPFYVYPNPKAPEFNEGMDLLCRGVEWLSGGRRINDYAQLMEHVQKWGMDPKKIEMFLEAFRYGAPPEGGFAFGAERMTMQILGLKNIREATMFPRDMNRIDGSLSENKE